MVDECQLHEPCYARVPHATNTFQTTPMAPPSLNLVFWNRFTLPKHAGCLTTLLIFVGSEDFGETLNRHGETGNGPDAEDDHFPTTDTKRSLSYADAARGTKRYVTFE